ncbi:MULTISPECIES: VWA domain-containing protein [Bacillus]|uniref:VWA domain-containing protein n=1 Tax=Bacillus TaxID=1386 RepID=UPI00224A638E|nr:MULTISPECIES: VWA domain-containing protein [Bacillus]MCX2823903.1 VWA domain-containing protein [Bacillus sp. H1F1]MCY7683597.1 VWA domain-containing protein [Bacillus velezensis]MEC1395320.1 VWA domain-containing protein [Bacillus velezensis]
MNKLQEIKLRISKLKGYENAKSTDQYWMTKEHVDFLIDRTELSVKQQAIIEEYQRQQEVAVNQFRQAREEISRLRAENNRFKEALQVYANKRNYESRRRKVPGTAINGEKISASLIEIDKGQTAREALEGDAE